MEAEELELVELVESVELVALEVQIEKKSNHNSVYRSVYHIQLVHIRLMQ